MIAKQTVLSASLLALLVASAEPARADPGAPPERPDEAPFDDPVPEAPPVRPDGKTGYFQIGAGFQSDEGFIASARVAQDNLFRTGTKLALDAKISARQQRFVVGFEDPTLFGTNVTLSANLYREVRVLPGFTRDATGSSLTLSHALGPHVRGFIGYRLEQIEVTPDNEVSARGTQAIDPFRGGRLAAIRAGIEYNTLDNVIWPRRGTRVGTAIEIADRDLGSEIQMIRTDAWMSHHRPLGPLTLHLGGTLSTVSSGAPFSERLHFDGNRDIRGYAPGALGPFDPQTGMSLGGELKYTARGELEVPLFPRYGISAVGWVDAGGILVHGTRWSGASAGLGLAWRSPIGLIRLDYAIPLDGGKPGVVFGLGGTW
jgi:outer membrane protein insertion porin family